MTIDYADYHRHTHAPAIHAYVAAVLSGDLDAIDLALAQIPADLRHEAKARARALTAAPPERVAPFAAVAAPDFGEQWEAL